MEPQRVDNGTPVWVLARILGLFDRRLPSAEVALKGIWTIFGIGDLEEVKRPLTRNLINHESDDDDDWNDSLLPRPGQFTGESDDAFMSRWTTEERRHREARDHPVGRVYVACAYLGSKRAEKLIINIRKPPRRRSKIGLSLSQRESTLRIYLDDFYLTPGQ